MDDAHELDSGYVRKPRSWRKYRNGVQVSSPTWTPAQLRQGTHCRAFCRALTKRIMSDPRVVARYGVTPEVREAAQEKVYASFFDNLFSDAFIED